MRERDFFFKKKGKMFFSLSRVHFKSLLWSGKIFREAIFLESSRQAELQRIPVILWHPKGMAMKQLRSSEIGPGPVQSLS